MFFRLHATAGVPIIALYSRFIDGLYHVCERGEEEGGRGEGGGERGEGRGERGGSLQSLPSLIKQTL